MAADSKSKAEILRELMAECNNGGKARMMQVIEIESSYNVEHVLDDKAADAVFRLFLDSVNYLSESDFGFIVSEAREIAREPKYSKKVIFLPQSNG